MKLTERKAIELSIELWTWLAETGDTEKRGWPEWGRNGGQYPHIDSYCFLCEGSERTIFSCGRCPYYAQYEYCLNDNTPYAKWHASKGSENRKEYAQKFLNQLRTLLGDKENITVEIELDAETLKTIKSLHKIAEAILEGLAPEGKESIHQ